MRFAALLFVLASSLSACTCAPEEPVPPTPCVPATCADLGKNCGAVNDGCGGFVSCGTCSGGEFCGASGVDHVCSVPKGICSADGWCVERMLPLQGSVRGLAATSAEHVFVGAYGAAMLDVGAVGWHFESVPYAYAIAASGNENAWALTDTSGMWRWDGTAWAQVTDGPGGEFLWTSSATDTWVSGTGGTYHHDGDTWTRVSSNRGPVTGLAGGPWYQLAYDPKGTKAFEVDPAGKLIALPTPPRLISQLGVAPNGDVWGVGHGIVRYVAGAWTVLSEGYVDSVLAVGADDVWFSTPNGLMHWDGAVLHDGVLASPSPVLARIPGTNDVVAAGDEGQLWFWSGGTWRGLNPVPPYPLSRPGMGGLDVAGSLDDGSVLIGGGWTIVAGYRQGVLRPWRRASVRVAAGTTRLCGDDLDHFWITDIARRAFYFDGTEFVLRAESAPALACAAGVGWITSPLRRWTAAGWVEELQGKTIRDISGLADGTLWAVGEALFRWTSGTWQRIDLPPELPAGRLSVTALSSSQALVTKEGGTPDTTWRFDGASWTKESATFDWSISAPLSAAGPNDIWIWEGGARRVLHFDGTWSSLSLPPGLVTGFASGSPAALGGGGVLLPANAWETRWSSVESPTAAHANGTGAVLRYDPTRREWDSAVVASSRMVNAVGGSSADDVWAAGDAGLVSHRVAGTWTDVATPTLSSLRAVTATTSHAWAAGWDGTILEVANGKPKLLASGTTAHLHAAFALSDSDVWFGGDGGTLLRWNGVTFSPVTLTKEVIHGLWARAADDVWVAGTQSLFHLDGSGTWVTATTANSDSFTGVSGVGGALFVTSTSNRLYSNQPSWRAIELPFVGEARSVAAVGTNDVFVAGGDAIVHGDGSTWSREAEAFTQTFGCRSVWAASSQDVWAACPSAGIVHRHRP